MFKDENVKFEQEKIKFIEKTKFKSTKISHFEIN